MDVSCLIPLVCRTKPPRTGVSAHQVHTFYVNAFRIRTGAKILIKIIGDTGFAQMSTTFFFFFCSTWTEGNSVGENSHKVWSFIVWEMSADQGQVDDTTYRRLKL